MRQIGVDGRELRHDGQGCLHIDGQSPIRVRVPRDEAAIRSVGEIASDELTQAVIYLIGDSVTISEDALVRAVMALFVGVGAAMTSCLVRDGRSNERSAMGTSPRTQRGS
jgi:hypothetical protein